MRQGINLLAIELDVLGGALVEHEPVERAALEQPAIPADEDLAGITEDGIVDLVGQPREERPQADSIVEPSVDAGSQAAVAMDQRSHHVGRRCWSAILVQGRDGEERRQRLNDRQQDKPHDRSDECQLDRSHR